jgi:basic membrane protein A and related proteins
MNRRRIPVTGLGIGRGRRAVYALLVAVLCLGATACGGDDNGGGASGSGGDGAAAQKKVGMALVGPRNDGGFNQSHYEGLVAAEKEHGVKGTVVENIAPGQPRVDALKNLAIGNDLVIGVGAEFAAGGLAVAPQFPEKKFVIINGQLSDKAPNLSVYFVREGVPAYIAGTVAAELTKTKTVGFVGGELIPPTKQSDDAFKAAAQKADPSIKYQTVNTGDFNNVSLAKQATATLVSQGADVIFLMLDRAFAGAQQAIQESGKDVKVFSIIVPRCETAKNIVGCATLNASPFVVAIVGDFVDNKLPTGEMKTYGVEDPEIQAFELCPEWAKQPALASIVEEQTKQINDGTLKMPEGV